MLGRLDLCHWVLPGSLCCFLLLLKPFSGGLAEEVISNTLLSRNCQHLKAGGMFGLLGLTWIS